MKRLPLLLLLFLPVFLFSCRKGPYSLSYEETVSDNGAGTGSVTWTKDKSYILDGLVFVNDGQTLTIEAGTVIRARTGQGIQSSALIIARGGKIIAQGTSDEPIIFTVEGDDLEGSIPYDAQGLWGGVVILGNATLNTESGEAFIEGIPISEPRGIYGGSYDDDNSGIFTYVSIRHGGTNIGEGNEINGLTLGGVGRKTIIDHVEVIANADDGVEFFGGTVNTRNMVVAFCGDDAFDMDEGYRGKGQFWLAINGPSSDHCAEHNGGDNPVHGLPYSNPEIYNATYAGYTGKPDQDLISFSEDGTGHYANSIFLNPGQGIRIEYINGQDDSYHYFSIEEISFANNIVYPVSEGDTILYTASAETPDLSSENSLLQAYFTANNSISDPGITAGESFSLMPPNTAFSDMKEYSDPWFEEVSYKGAFGSNNWIAGWTLLYETGLVSDL